MHDESVKRAVALQEQVRALQAQAQTDTLQIATLQAQLAQERARVEDLESTLRALAGAALNKANNRA